MLIQGSIAHNSAGVPPDKNHFKGVQTMKQLRIISVTVLAMLILSTSAMAWSGYHAKRCNTDCDQTRQANHLELMSVILDLSAEQQQQIEELCTAHQQKRAQMRSDLREARQQMRVPQPGASTDIEDLKAKARTYADLKAAMLVDKIEHRQQMFNILTPQQQKKAAELAELKSTCSKWNRCAGKAPSTFAKGRGCNTQGQNARTNCDQQFPCMMSRCR
jgi:Spy/CpxP family protein refolding chaperone